MNTFVAGADEMIPFTLPWNDTSDNITNLAYTLHAPAGKYGRVEVSESGKYLLNEERIRFFGVNIVAAAAFPPQEKATEIADRLARFGMNVVRFHHLDNDWTESIFDYKSGSSKTLDPENLDRLDKFIAELKRTGIYSNLNLLCSRQFFRQDGLHPDVESMDTKEAHILAFFDEGARNLHKEFALNILTHVNPYTGLAYTEDPAIAFVEINNENGLIHQWHLGTLDRLPSHYKKQLLKKWNAWLQSKYNSNDELLEAWGVIDESLGSQILTNGDFSSESTKWNLETHQNAQADFTVGNYYNGQPAAQITIINASDASWHVQLTQSQLQIVSGQIYTVGYWIRSDSFRNISVSLMQAHDPWQSLGYEQNHQTGSEWQFYEESFLANTHDTNARLNFGGMGNSTGIVEIARVEFRKGGKIGGIPDGSSIEQGNIPTLVKGSRQMPGNRNDWFCFMRETEQAYWTDMNAFVKAIGYEGIIWGTTIMNSPPSVQSLYPAIDSHSYWNHPQFQNGAWNAVDWTVNNTSMVNDPNGGVIPDLSWQRIRGKPHNVTEYQHSSPNTFSSEGPLFLSAYASLQDWDGLYLFHYGSSDNDWDRGYFNGFFDVDQHPAKLANAALASLIFRRFDIQPAQVVVAVPFSNQTELQLLTDKGAAWNVGDARHLEMPDHLPLIHRVEMVVEAEQSDGRRIELPDFPEIPAGNRFQSDTNELIWDLENPGAGVILLDTSKSKGVWGFQSGKEWVFQGLRLQTNNTRQNWCTLMIVFTEGTGFQHLSSGGKGIIVCTGYTENTHMGWKDASLTSVGAQWGTAPTLIENITSQVVFEVPPNHLSLWSLDEKGNRLSRLPVTSHEHGTSIHLGGINGSLWYEFQITPFSSE